MATMIGYFNCNQTAWIDGGGTLWRVDNNTPWDAEPDAPGGADGDDDESSPIGSLWRKIKYAFYPEPCGRTR